MSHPPTDEQAVVQAYNESALDLYQALDKGTGNVVISPYSIGVAMAMALSGARGDTEKEMARVLNQAIPRERIDAANSKILAIMNRFQEEQDIVLSTANALCLTGGGGLVDRGYKALLSTLYQAELFSAHNVEPINAWVMQKTHDKIDKILDELDANSVCVLLNAIYFKGLWASQFDGEQTRPGTFYATGGETLSVPTMHQTANYALLRQDEVTALAMPYRDPSLAMVIVLPNDRMGLAQVEGRLTFDTIQPILTTLERRWLDEVALTLPRFEIAFDASLVPPFKKMGIRSAFSSERADFGGITGPGSEPGTIWISQIKHKAVLEVNEEGSEAAAATAIEFATRSIPMTTTFLVDHPFLFFLVDKTTGAILFMGRVTDPTQGGT